MTSYKIYIDDTKTIDTEEIADLIYNYRMDKIDSVIKDATEYTIKNKNCESKKFTNLTFKEKSAWNTAILKEILKNIENKG